MSNQVLLTKEGKEKLEKKLYELETVRRLEVANKIKEARSFGDLSENAEYDAAKEEQAVIESEIVDINKILLNATIIDEEKLDTKKVSVGCFVTVLDMEDKDETEYQIVGTTEASVREKKISNESPIGRALLGRKKNEIIKVETPNGSLAEYKIIKIRV